jgi:hypothetical protein
MFDSTKVGELQNVPHIALLFKLATQWIEKLDGIFGIPDHYRQIFNAGADQSRAMQLHERNRTLVGAPRRVSSPLLEVLALVAAVAIDHFALMGEKAVAAHLPAATSRPKIAASPTAFWIWSVRPAMFSSAEVAKKCKAAEDATTTPPPQAGDALAADAEDFCFVSRESIADADPSVNAGGSNEASATADDEVRAKKKPARVAKLRRRLLRLSGESTRLRFRSSFPNWRSIHQLRLHVRHARRPLHRQAHALHVRAIGPARANGTSTPATQQARSSRSKASLTTVSSSTATST